MEADQHGELIRSDVLERLDHLQHGAGVLRGLRLELRQAREGVKRHRLGTHSMALDRNEAGHTEPWNCSNLVTKDHIDAVVLEQPRLREGRPQRGWCLLGDEDPRRPSRALSNEWPSVAARRDRMRDRRRLANLRRSGETRNGSGCEVAVDDPSGLFSSHGRELAGSMEDVLQRRLLDPPWPVSCEKIR